MAEMTAWKAVKKHLIQGDAPSELGPPFAIVIGGFILVAYLVALLWPWYTTNAPFVGPVATFLGAAVVAWTALQQARTARLRHEEQTKADWQRRITESFSKAAEQLGNDKLEVRLGGIYTMERISKESPADYWPVMETLTAFVRERARWKEPNETRPETVVGPFKARGKPGRNWTAVQRDVPTDIAAVLSVICRRDKVNRERERQMQWRFDLRGSDLRGARLMDMHLESASLSDAHFEVANLMGAHLEGANLMGAHFEGANLMDAHLEGANLTKAHLESAIALQAHLEGAVAMGAHLERAYLQEAHLEVANLMGAHLEGANLMGATGLRADQLTRAFGDASTKLPEGIERGAHWPPAKP